jgi:hypothetical protein
MTEAEWLSSTDPKRMLEFLRARATDRKLRLFIAGICRNYWHLLSGKPYRQTVDVAERFGDGLATAEELNAVHADADGVAEWGDEGGSPGPLWYAGWFTNLEAGARDQAANPDAPSVLAMAIAMADAQSAAELCLPWATALGLESEVIAVSLHLLRDIFKPFRPAPTLEPAWLAWNNGIVRRLAEAAYQERSLPAGILDVARLGVLADALEEAGCTHAELLGHLRSPGPHVRGCFAVDLLLARH